MFGSKLSIHSLVREKDKGGLPRYFIESTVLEGPVYWNWVKILDCHYLLFEKESSV